MPPGALPSTFFEPTSFQSVDSTACTQSQIGYGLLIFQTYPCINLTSKPAPRGVTQKSRLHAQRLSEPITTTEYLVRSLGLSRESAGKSKPTELKSISNADSVLALFRDYGFTDSQLATFFSVRPKLLGFDAHGIWKPKLDFLAQNGVSGETLVNIFTKDPSVLAKSLSKTIAPCFDFLRAFLGTKATASLFSPYRGASILRHFSDATAPNAEAMRSFGVPDENIVNLFLKRANVLRCHVDKFPELLDDVKEAGFDPQRMMFIYALCVFKHIRKEKRVSKMGLLKNSFGWSDEQVRDLIVKQPTFLRLPEHRLKEVVDFFMNRLEWTPEDIAKYPSVLFCNFEDKIFPRLSVVQVLIAKGLKKKTCIGWAIKASEPVFLERYVHRYEQAIPNLLELYQQNLHKSVKLG